jgi:hypothetical protein
VGSMEDLASLDGKVKHTPQDRHLPVNLGVGGAVNWSALLGHMNHGAILPPDVVGTAHHRRGGLARRNVMVVPEVSAVVFPAYEQTDVQIAQRGWRPLRSQRQLEWCLRQNRLAHVS